MLTNSLGGFAPRASGTTSFRCSKRRGDGHHRDWLEFDQSSKERACNLDREALVRTREEGTETHRALVIFAESVLGEGHHSPAATASFRWRQASAIHAERSGGRMEGRKGRCPLEGHL